MEQSATLASWNDRSAKASILEFVRLVTTPGGSATMVEYRDGDLYRTAGVEQPIDDGPGKPVHIWTRTGRKPLLAGGNADGDIPMLETARFAFLLHHDDGEREFAYDGGAEQPASRTRQRSWRGDGV